MPSRRRHRRRAEEAAASANAPRTVASAHEAGELARELLSPDRPRPVAVVSVPREHSDSYIDAERIASELGELADVVVLATPEASWALSKALPDRTQVYGGAGRVYPAGDGWTSDPYTSPLSFAYGPQDTERATTKLITDTLTIIGRDRADEPAAPDLRMAAGTVARLIAPSRAFVSLDDGTLATVFAELTVHGAPIEHILTTGQRVKGLFDPESKRLDVRGELVPGEVAVAQFSRGEVVPARVAQVANDVVTLLLHPGVRCVVPRDRVTANPRDSLRSLFTEGEVVAARVAWVDDGAPRLRLDDIDDDEDVLPAPALLPGGPPWLAAPAPPVFTEPDRADDDGGSGAARTGLGTVDGWDAGRSGQAAAVVVVEPTEGDAPGEKAPRGAVRTLSQTVDVLKARLTWVSDRLRAAEQERDEAARRARDLDLELEQTRADLQSARTRYRNQGQQLEKERAARLRERKGRAPRTDEPVAVESAFADTHEQLRHEVYLAWVARIPASDKAERPLPQFTIGPRFLDSLDAVEGVSRSKVLDVVVEVLTGLAKDIPGRDLHMLRTGGGGSNPQRAREDGAVCWRTAIQRETASARRLHYWVLPGGEIELSRVVLHDDMEP